MAKQQKKAEKDPQSAKEKAAQHAIDDIKERFGDGSIMRISNSVHDAFSGWLQSG